MLNINYQKHNESVQRLLENEQKGIYERVKMSIACNPRLIISDPLHNKEKLTFEGYTMNSQKMLEIQCRFREYMADDIICDKQMGFENEEGIFLYPDTQNVLEAEYFGCDVAYHGIYEPGTKVCLNDDNKYAFLDREFPSIFSGLSGKIFEHMDYFKEQQKNGFTYKGKPISDVGSAGLSTDGPFTIACCLLGTTELCIALYEDEKFAMDLLAYITDATIARIKAVRAHLGLTELTQNIFLADDSIAMLSDYDYQRFVLPFHKKLISDLASEGTANCIHLCGDATHLFPTLQKHLHIVSFDTGFPVQHGKLVQMLAPNTAIFGGVHANLLLAGSEKEIMIETKRILEEVKPYTKKYIIKEANNVCPGTPPQNILAMYEAVKRYGCY